MTFQEALELSQFLTKTEQSKVYAQRNELLWIPDGDYNWTVYWNGHKHLCNRCTEAAYNEYLTRVESGHLVVGPAAYSSQGSLHFLDDCVGLWVK